MKTTGHYSLDQTFSCGQAFRWRQKDGAWESVLGVRWVRVEQGDDAIIATAAAPVADWSWLAHYLQVRLDYDAMIASFPRDELMRDAVQACHGMRLLRQDPWECLASFILSSCKQVAHIQQMVDLLSKRFGESAAPQWFSFPSAERLSRCSEKELRDCKLGFRAPYLLEAARAVALGKIDLAALERMPYRQALESLVRLPGVGAKIANCVLLFACGFHEAFPVDVWIRRIVRERYLTPRRMPPSALESFAREYFGPTGGYAQQYLFHYHRVHL